MQKYRKEIEKYEHSAAPDQGVLVCLKALADIIEQKLGSPDFQSTALSLLEGGVEVIEKAVSASSKKTSKK